MGILAKAKTPLVQFASTSDISRMLKAPQGDRKVAPSLVTPPPLTTPLPYCTPPSPHSSGHLSHPGPAPRRHLLYFDMVIPNAATVGLDHVGSYRHSLIRSMDEVFKVDSSISLFPYGLPLSNEAEVLKSGSTLGNTLSQLEKYFDGLRLTRDAFPPFLFLSSWVSTRRKNSLSPTAKPSSRVSALVLLSALSNLPRSLLPDGFLGPIMILTQLTWPKSFKRPWIPHTLAMASIWASVSSHYGVVPKKTHRKPPHKPPLPPPAAFQASGSFI